MDFYTALKTNKNGVFILGFILLLSLTIRLVFFNGPFGSDEIVYLARSLDVANGVWSSANYNGALRYGYNIPSGILIYLFGLNLFTANLWPLLCSLLEISAVFLFAWRYIGRKAALFSALLLAFMPLHVAVSTRLHADPVVSMFLTVSFITFYLAERTTDKKLYLTTGILLGCVFWVKELAALTFFAFPLYPLFFRTIKPEWIYLILGGLIMLLAHFALMDFIADDPLHAIKTVLNQVKTGFVAANQGEDGPWYYFQYLFFDIKHTWLTPIFALIAIIFFRKGKFFEGLDTVKFCIFWLVSLLFVLSFFPVSFTPLRFAMKQSNYITLFLAPLTLIAGAAISALPRRPAYLLIFLALSGGFVLSALEQQAYQVFTANSKGLLAFSENHPGRDIYGSVNNGRIACFYEIFNGGNCNDVKIHDFSEIPADNSKQGDIPVFTVIDRENLGWGRADIKIEKAPACWSEIETVIPASMGNSRFIVDFILFIGKFLPYDLTNKFREMQHPKPAKIYSANLSDLWCDRD